MAFSFGARNRVPLPDPDLGAIEQRLDTLQCEIEGVVAEANLYARSLQGSVRRINAIKQRLDDSQRRGYANGHAS